MGFKYGSKTELWLDGVDVSQYFSAASFALAVDTGETTTFKASWKTFIEGDAAATMTASGYYDANNDAALASALRNGGSVLTYFPAGCLAIGDLGRLIAVHETAMSESDPVGGVVLMNVGFQAEGIVGFGAGLHILSTDTNTTTGTGLDGGASTSTGWHAHLHVTAVSAGSWVVKLQDSSDNSSFSDVTGGAFTAATTATAQRLAGAALTTTLRRYVRYVATRTGGSAGDNITFGLAISRN